MVWCYGTFQDSLYRDLKSIREDIEYAEGIPVDLQNMFDSNKKNLIILDNMMHECAKDDRVTQLFTRGRHSNLSVILLSQGQYHKNQRTINLNSDYLVIFKNARDRSQIYNLARQFIPTNPRFLVWAYEDATKTPHSYLLLDLSPSTDDKHRVRTNIFPEESPEYVYIPNK